MPSCKNCQQDFTITDADRQFYNKMNVPEPTWCPGCRLLRRLTWRNVRCIYQRNCDLCGAQIISIFSPDKKLKVYCSKCYWSDSWDELATGRDYDFSRSFNEQFKDLIMATPHSGVNNEDCVNSEYTNLGYHNSNCYMCFGSDMSESSCYSFDSVKTRDSFDIYYCSELELCSRCVDCHRSYDTHFSQESENLQTCYFCYDCRNCRNCFGCAGLRNKEYYFYNQPLKPAEWREKVDEEFKNKKISDLYFETKKIWLTAPRRASVLTKADGCTGNHLRYCSRVYDSFDCLEAENAKYCIHTIPKIKDCMDVYGSGAAGELMYDYVTGFGYNVIFSSLAYKSARDIAYCFVVPGCRDCFGCSSLKNKKFCILNKQYPEKEYFELKAKIIGQMKQAGEWGEFFNISISPFAYNETEAFDFFPLSREEIIAQGYNWREEDVPLYKEGDPAKNIYSCQTCNKLFKIIKQELDFLAKQNLPLPVDCYKCRFKFLFNLRNPYKLWERQCAKCGQGIKTTYAPERQELVYCEECYQKEIY